MLWAARSGVYYYQSKRGGWKVMCMISFIYSYVWLEGEYFRVMCGWWMWCWMWVTISQLYQVDLSRTRPQTITQVNACCIHHSHLSLTPDPFSSSVSISALILSTCLKSCSISERGYNTFRYWAAIIPIQVQNRFNKYQSKGLWCFQGSYSSWNCTRSYFFRFQLRHMQII